MKQCTRTNYTIRVHIHYLIINFEEYTCTYCGHSLIAQFPVPVCAVPVLQYKLCIVPIRYKQLRIHSTNLLLYKHELYNLSSNLTYLVSIKCRQNHRRSVGGGAWGARPPKILLPSVGGGHVPPPKFYWMHHWWTV